MPKFECCWKCLPPTQVNPACRVHAEVPVESLGTYWVTYVTPTGRVCEDVVRVEIHPYLGGPEKVALHALLGAAHAGICLVLEITQAFVYVVEEEPMQGLYEDDLAALYL